MPQLDPVIINSQIIIFISFFGLVYYIFVAKVLPMVCKIILVSTKVYYAVACTGLIMLVWVSQKEVVAPTNARLGVLLDMEVLQAERFFIEVSQHSDCKETQ